MIKVIVVGDIHNMGNNPSCRKDFFPETLNKKILELVDIVNREQVDMVLFTGDLFHTPDTANQIVKNFGQNLLKMNCPKYSIIGNHDIYGGNITSSDRSKIGLLEAFGVINIIKNTEPIYFEKDNIRLQITGQSYVSDIDLSNNKKSYYCKEKNPNVDWAIHLIHGFLINSSLPFAHTTVNEIKDTQVDITISGHLHYPFEEKIDNKLFINPGALSRITASKTELRQPQILKFEFDKNNYEYTKIPISSAPSYEDVIDRTKLKEDLKEIYDLNAFINSIKSFSVQNDLNFEELVRFLAKSENISENIISETIKEINKAQEDLFAGGEE